MKTFKAYLFLVLTISFLVSACSDKSGDIHSREVKNLTAFAKVYGHVKYFHPSDESRQIDWDKFAIAGVKKVATAKNDEELKAILEGLFLPIAPTVTISRSKPIKGSFLEKYKDQVPQDSSYFPIFWQHRGVNLEQKNSLYTSIRRYRHDKVVGSNFLLYQSFNEKSFNGNLLRFRASVKAEIEGGGNSGRLYLRIDDSDGYPLYINSADKGSATSNDWKELNLQAMINDAADQITAGIKLNGDGKLWVDNVRLDVKNIEGEWEPVTVLNPGFEDQTNGRPAGWRSTVTGNYDFSVVSDQSYVGENSFYMANRNVNPPVTLFSREPELGETAVQKISDELWSEVPLVLYGDLDNTFPQSSESGFHRLKKELDSVDLNYVTAEDKNVRLADVIIAWNELQHFYPYFDVIDVDWNEQLAKALTASVPDQTPDDFFETLSKMLASTKDGHIGLYHPAVMRNTSAGLPFLVDWIEEQVIVTYSLHTDIKPGDIIVTLDGIPAEEIIEKEKQLISGSPQLSLFRTMQRFGIGKPFTKLLVEVKNEEGIKEYTIQRSSQNSLNNRRKSQLPVLGAIDDGVFYVDLDRASMDQINNEIETIASGKGVIFDLRGYPNNNHQVISHLLTEPDTSSRWMRVPQMIYPDQENIVGYHELGWSLKPAQPHIQGKVIFITDSRAISYAESFMSFIEHYKLAEIVGQPTAGTNGNINTTSLPGGYRYAWTGMKVVKHDGSQHFQIGIQPTVPVQKTIEGVRNGRDEFLDKAIEILNASITISEEETIID